MKAIVVREYGGPEVMRLEDVPAPEPPDSQVLVRVLAVGVNPVDTYLRSGNHAHAPELPYTPGKDAAGVVEAVGDAVERWKPGDRVYTADTLTGTYAEYALCGEEQLGSLPDNVSFEQGAGIWTPYATAYRALFQKADVKSGETVLVHGASGGVGLAAVQWLTGGAGGSNEHSCTVIGTASSEQGRQLILDNGADASFDHTDEAHFQQVKEFTGSRGVDVIIEMLANANLEPDFECLAMRGRIVIVGNRGSLQFTPRLAMTKDATIYGMSLFNSSQQERDEVHAAIFKGLSLGTLKPEIGRRFTLADAPAAHREIIASKALGKMVLIT